MLPWMAGTSPAMTMRGWRLVLAVPDVMAGRGDVPQDPDRQPRRNCLPHHTDGEADGNRHRGRLFGCRRRGIACADGRRSDQDWTSAICRELSQDRADCRRLPAERSRGSASRLRVPIGEPSVRASTGQDGSDLYRPACRSDRRDGRQNRIEKTGSNGRGVERARPPRRHTRCGSRGPDRARDRLSGHDQGFGGRRR